jgi:hypothetical protein
MCLLLGIFFFGIFKLETVPPLWWDEGWTISVARNWVESGHYGLLINGVPRSAGLSGHFPVVASVALSFKLLGVGVWQARLPFVFYTLGTFGLLFFLSERLNSRKVAYVTMGVLLLLTGTMATPPILEGRQVLGEIPGTFFVLLGFIGLYLSFYRSKWYVVFACLFWGLALRTKAQILPFWLASLSLPLLISIFKRWWSESRFLTASLIGSWIISRLFRILELSIIGDQFVNERIPGLFSVTAFVLNLNVRLVALIYILTMGILPIIGLFVALKKELKALKGKGECEPIGIINMGLLVYAGSWLLWYISFAMWWPRYLVSPLVISSIFLSTYLVDYFSNVNLQLRSPYQDKINLSSKHHRKRIDIYFVFIMVVILTTAIVICIRYVGAYTNKNWDSYENVINFLNNNTPEDSIIETYDSELFFQLDRLYHYPPDNIFTDLVRNREFNLEKPIPYNPLDVDPDYIVVGYHSKIWKLYDPYITSDIFNLAQDFSGYQVYERVR